MKKALAAIFAGTVLAGIAVWVARGVFVRRLTEGDAESNEFSLAAIVGGVERTSTAPALRRGRVVAACGGVDLDLREATLDPGGADILLEAYFGGVKVDVPKNWRVSVDSQSTTGGVQADVTPPEELPEDAPSLRLEVVAKMGGVLVTSETEE